MHEDTKEYFRRQLRAWDNAVYAWRAAPGSDGSRLAASAWLFLAGARYATPASIAKGGSR